MQSGDYISVSIFEDDECLSHHFVMSCPPYQVGQIFWFERRTISGTKYEHAKPIRLSKYKIVDVQHRISEDYNNSISHLFSVEVMIERVKDE